MAIVRRGGDGGAGRLARASLVLGLGGLGLAACATAPERPGLVSPTPSPSARPPSGSVEGGAGGGYSGGLHGTDKPYQINGVWYRPHAEPNFDQVGYASWYGQAFHNKHTADGEIFDQYALSAAHKTLPLPSIIEVTNLDNGKSLRLRLNDRGPFVDGRMLDVSRAAAEQLGFAGKGLTRVRVRYVGPAPAFFTPVMYASTDPSVNKDHHFGADTPRAREADLLTVSREPTAPVEAASLPAAAAPPAPAEAPAAPPAPTAAEATDRYAESSVALTPGALAPVTAATAAPAMAAPPSTLAPSTLAPASAPVAPPNPVEMAAVSSPPGVSPPPEPAPAPAAAPPASPSAGFAVQAGAFANRANAERVAAQLGSSAAIRPLDRGGVTLYRVVLTGYADAGAAAAGRQQAIDAGFAGARIVAAN